MLSPLKSICATQRGVTLDSPTFSWKWKHNSDLHEWYLESPLERNSGWADSSPSLICAVQAHHHTALSSCSYQLHTRWQLEKRQQPVVWGGGKQAELWERAAPSPPQGFRTKILVVYNQDASLFGVPGLVPTWKGTFNPEPFTLVSSLSAVTSLSLPVLVPSHHF